MEKTGFKDLPEEIMLLIFSYLTQAQLKTVVAPVCRKWWKLSNAPALWKQVHSLFINNQSTMQSFCENVQCSLTQALSVICPKNSTDSLERSFECFPLLKVLKLESSGRLSKDFLEILSSKCKFIESVTVMLYYHESVFPEIPHLSTLANLRTLTIKGISKSYPDAIVKIIAKNCCHLESLTLENNNIPEAVLDNTLTLYFTDKSILKLSKYRSKSLHHLSLETIKLTETGILSLGELKNLVYLKLTLIPESEISTNFGPFPQLRTLKLTCLISSNPAYKLHQESFSMFATNCPLIENLNFSFLQDEFSLLQMCQITFLSNLCSLTVVYRKGLINESAIQTLADNCCQLETLHLSRDKHWPWMFSFGTRPPGFYSILNLCHRSRDTLRNLSLEVTRQGIHTIGKCQNLVQLSLIFTDPLLFNFPWAALGPFPKLSTLSLMGRLKKEHLESFFSEPPAYEFLHILDIQTYCTTNYDVFGNIASKCVNLRYLTYGKHLDNSNENYQELQSLRSCKQLRMINIQISDMLGVCDLDVPLSCIHVVLISDPVSNWKHFLEHCRYDFGFEMVGKIGCFTCDGPWVKETDTLKHTLTQCAKISSVLNIPFYS